ncbi:MAG: DUF420 domain-containing protein [Cytophagaceae bacterium]
MSTIRTSEVKNNSFYLSLIWVLSVAIPVVVAVLFYMPQTGKLGDLNVSFLPHLNAALNSSTALALIAGFYFIKKNQQKNHTYAMLSAFALSSIFLVSYVIYHFQGSHTLFGVVNGDGVLSVDELAAVSISRYIYLFILITHILLAIVVVPFVLLAIYFAATKQFVSHKKVVKYGFPVWLYVAVTGVLVYLMISPYYS